MFSLEVSRKFPCHRTLCVVDHGEFGESDVVADTDTDSADFCHPPINNGNNGLPSLLIPAHLLDCQKVIKDQMENVMRPAVKVRRNDSLCQQRVKAFILLVFHFLERMI